ncbi:MAG: lamin tail domain-containing protein, partial [bacterium]
MRLQFFCLLFSSLFFSASQVPAQVVLSEIMFDPLGNDTHDEFIEIVNLSESISVNLSNWQISDGEGFDTIIEFNEGIVLNPKQFGIILDPSYFENSNTYDNLIPESSLILTIDNSTFGSRGLSNSTPETVSLIKSTGEIASQYTYSLGNDMGYSDEKIDLAGANSPENWANSQVLFGTPGRPNSVSPLNYDLAIFSEDVKFVPSKVIAEESVMIKATIRNLGYLPATNFYVTFFEDTDRDSLAETGEELSSAFEFEGTLLQGDSTSFSMAYDNISPDRHLIMVKINFTLDENTTNNLALKELLVGYRERTMIINEIMYSPLPEQAEWVEILNLYSQAINLNQWHLS